MASGVNGTVAREIGRLLRLGTLAGLTDQQLLERFAGRGRSPVNREAAEAAFEAILTRHGPMVRAVCRRLVRDPNEADDAFQAAFLVLARKAGSVRLGPTASLGPWLHGVASRVALRAAVRRSRRLARENGPDAAEGLPDPDDDPAWVALDRAERLGALHQEIARLPEKYRAPVVLCHLEGLGHQEAAHRLGWPIGTVKGRLSRARDTLRGRLAARGVAPAAGAFGVLLAREARAVVAATPPASLFKSTLTAALGATAGKLTATAPLAVAVLAEGVLRTMIVATGLKTVAVGLFAVGLLAGGAGGYGYVASEGQSALPGEAAIFDPEAAAGGRSGPIFASLRENEEGRIAVLDGESPPVAVGRTVEVPLEIEVRPKAKRVTLGQPAAFEVAITHSGDLPPRDVTLSFTHSAGLMGKDLRLSLEEFDRSKGPGGAWTKVLTFETRATGSQACHVTVNGLDATMAIEARGEVEVLAPGLDISFEGPVTVEVGHTASFALKVSNTSDEPIVDVTAAIKIPTGGLPRTADPSGAIWKPDRRVLWWSLRELPPGEDREFSVEVRFDETGETKLSAGARARGLDDLMDSITVVVEAEPTAEFLPARDLDIALSLDEPVVGRPAVAVEGSIEPGHRPVEVIGVETSSNPSAGPGEVVIRADQTSIERLLQGQTVTIRAGRSGFQEAIVDLARQVALDVRIGYGPELKAAGFEPETTVTISATPTRVDGTATISLETAIETYQAAFGPNVSLRLDGRTLTVEAAGPEPVEEEGARSRK